MNLYSINKVQLRHFMRKDGLTANTIHTIEEDKNGTLYLLSDRGLTIYKNREFTKITQKEYPVFSNQISTLIILPYNKVLLATRDKGIFLFDSSLNLFVNITSKTTNLSNINNFAYDDKTNTLWFSSLNKKLYYAKLDNDFYQNNTLNPIKVTYSLGLIKQMKIHKGNLYIVSDKSFIGILTLNNNQLFIDKILKNKSLNLFNSFHFVDDENILVSTNEGVYHLKQTNQNWDITKYIKINGLVTGLSNLDSNIYVATFYKGIYNFDINKQKGKFIATGIKKIINLKIINGFLYAGTWNEGFYEYALNIYPFTWSESYDESTKYSVWSIMNINDTKDFLIGTNGAGLLYFNDETNRCKSVNNQFYSIYCTNKSDSENNYLIGTWGNGLWSYDISKNTYETCLIPEIKHSRIYDIETVDPNHIYIATNNNGLWEYNGKNKTSKKLKYLKGDAENMIRSIKYDTLRHGLWIATWIKGIYFITLTKDYSIKRCELIKNSTLNGINKIINTSDTLYICAGSGLYVLDKNKKQLLCDKNFKGMIIKDCLIDKKNNLYAIASHDGLFLYQKQPQKIINYLSDIEVYLLHKPDTSSVLMCGSSEGIFKLDYTKLMNDECFAKAEISYSYQNNNQYKVSNNHNSITLAPKDNVIKLKLTAVGLHVFENKSVFYKMVGIDNKWNKLSLDDKKINYHNLAVGEYELIVRLYDINNKQGQAKLKIVVNPFWWQTKIAIFISILIFILIIIVFFYLYSKRKIRKQMQIIDKQRKEELHKQKVQFFTNISHDLKTPLTLLMTPLFEMQQKNNLPKEYKSKLNSMINNAKELLRRINRILQYKDAENNVFEINLSPVVISNLVYRIFKPFKDYAKSKYISFSFQINSVQNKEVIINTDSNLIESIIQNIVSNAIKYTNENGSVKAQCNITNRHLIIKVTDTGIGMNSETINHVFKRYYRASSDKNGTGLGLYVTKQYVDKLNGEIQIDSNESKGTCVTVSIPINNIDEEPIILSDNTNSDIVHSVLIVDDSPDMRDFLKNILDPYYKVITTNNANNAIELLNSENIDIIISDFMMPETNGADFAKKIKSNIITSHIPVIILTADNTIETRKKCWDAGVDLFEEKPFKQSLLLKKIKSLLHNRESLKYKYKIEKQKSISVNDNNISLDDVFINNINETIEKHIENINLSVEVLASELNMQHNQLYRKLKALTSVSVNQYIRAYRLNKAALLLKNKTYNVSEVLYKVGFNNASYFTKCFKKQFKVLPSEYLTTQNNGDE